MGHAAGKLADGFHLLGLAEKFLELLALGDVHQVADDFRGPALAVEKNLCSSRNQRYLPSLC